MKDWFEHYTTIPRIPRGERWIKNWFSNMLFVKLDIDGVIYSSVENYYQAMKTLDLNEREAIIKALPHRAKMLGKKVTLRPDWEEIKLEVMEKALRVKFNILEWKDKLLATEDEVIIEFNNWSDTFFGVSIVNHKGHNHLGLMLMKIREELKQQTKDDSTI